MTAGPRPIVVIVSAPGTLDGVDALLRRRGAAVVRLVALVPRPIAPSRWLPRLRRFAAPDTVVVTSRFAVEAAIRPWRRAAGDAFPTVEFWAVGPGTGAALRRAGVRRVRRPASVGASAVARALRRRRPRRVVYLRSERAGPDLARALRAQGHRVADVVAYRLADPPPWSPRDVRRVGSASLVVVTSPSALELLDRRLGRRRRPSFRAEGRLVTLGDRSRRAARKLGFRRISVAPTTTAHRFTRYVLRELEDARP